MAKNFPEYQAGTKIKSFDSSFLNALVALANAQPSPAPGGADTIPRPAGTVLVLNSTGADLDIGDPASIFGPMVTPTADEAQFTANLVMEATVVSGEGAGSFGVALQPIPNGTIGRMCVAGLCPALVTLDITKDYDRCDFDSGVLVAAEKGTAQIIWEPGTDGEDWCVIRFGATSEYLVKTDATDDTPGYLDDEIVAGASIVTAVNTSSSDHKLEISHGLPGDLDEIVGPMVGSPGGGNGVTIVGAAPATDPYISYTEYQDEADDNRHSIVNGSGAGKFIIVPDERVKVNAADPAAGYLEDKVDTTPAANPKWLNNSTVANKVLFEHATLLANSFFTTAAFAATGIANTGGGFEQAGATAGYCSFQLPVVAMRSDGAGHFRVIPESELYYRFLALPTDAATNDHIRWDGAKWVKVPWLKTVGDMQLSGTNLQVKYTQADGTLGAWETVTGWAGTECS